MRVLGGRERGGGEVGGCKDGKAGSRGGKGGGGKSSEGIVW